MPPRGHQFKYSLPLRFLPARPARLSGTIILPKLETTKFSKLEALK